MLTVIASESFETKTRINRQNFLRLSLRVLGFPLVAAAVAAERVLGRVEALPRGPHAEAVGTLAVHGGAVILEHVLGVDALLGREPVFAQAFA